MRFPEGHSTMKELTRDEAIDAIRDVLLTQVDDKTSVCQVASEKGVYCQGFSQWSFTELKERFPWIAQRHPELTRGELEALANRWCLTREAPELGRITCDLMARAPERKPCAGWQEWYEAELEHFCRDLLGEEVRVKPNPLPPQSAD